jgi:four helix bundle protein
MGKFAKSFRDLDVYQESLKLVVDVHRFCRTLPPEEKYVLADQMRRSSRSVCSNISEAWRKRRYKAAFISKLSDAETEGAEMQSWLDVAKELAYMEMKRHLEFDARYEHVLSQLVTMINDADKWCTL